MLSPTCGQCHEERQGRRGEQGHLQPLGQAQVPAVQEHRRQTPDREQQHEEGDQPQRGLRDRSEVEVHPRCHEEDRDEEPVPDRVELGLQRVDVAGRPSSQDHPRQERSEDDIEAELCRHHEQREEQRDCPSKGRLGRCMLSSPGHGGEPAEELDPGKKCEQDRDHEHRRQGQEAQELPVRTQEDGDPDDREELTDRSRGQDEGAEPAAEHVVVPQDRQQGSERGRGEAQRNRHEGVDEPDVGERAGHCDRETGRHEPGHDGEPAHVLGEQAQLQLVAGQQEQEAQADVGQQRDARRVGPPEDLLGPRGPRPRSARRPGAGGCVRALQRRTVREPRPAPPPAASSARSEHPSRVPPIGPLRLVRPTTLPGMPLGRLTRG